MCNLCNGKRVIHEFEVYGIRYVPCPNCRAKSEEIFSARMTAIKERIEVYKKEMSAVGN